MREFFQDFILNQIVVSVALIIVLGFVTRWAVLEKKELQGYGLGWLVSLLLLVTYTITFGDRPRSNPFADLSIFQIFLAIILGLVSGAAIQYSKDIGKDSQGHKSKRSVALQVALYTILNLVLLGLVIIESSVVQRMIGIYGLAFGVAFLLAMVWSNIDDEQTRTSETGAAQNSPSTPYDNNRPNFRNRR